MNKLLPISKLYSFTPIQGFLLRYITFSYINWLKNGKSSNLDEKIGI